MSKDLDCTVAIKIGDKTIRMLLDSGADISLFVESDFQLISSSFSPPLKRIPAEPLTAFNLSKQASEATCVPLISVLSSHVPPFEIKDAEFRIVAKGSISLFGKDLLSTDLGIELYHILRQANISHEFNDPVIKHLPESVSQCSSHASSLVLCPPKPLIGPEITRSSEILKILETTPQLFTQDLKHRRLRVPEVVITLIPNWRDVYRPQNKRPLDANKTKHLMTECDTLLELGLIKEVFDGEFVSNVVMVRQGPDKIRTCYDLTNLNKVVANNVFPLPRISEVIQNLKGKRFFATLDLLKGFFQLPLHADSQKYTTFFGPNNRLFQFTSCPFGLRSAPSEFQSAMQRILASSLVTRCFVYIDDVVIFGKDEGEFLTNLRMVLDQLDKGGATLNLDKCKFGLKEITYLGYVISGDRWCLKSDRYLQVARMPRPETVSQMRSFLGAASAFREFSQNFAAWEGILAKLSATNLDGRSKIIWNDLSTKAYDQILKMVSSCESLQMPDTQKTFYVFTDASLAGTGGLICQEAVGDKVLRLPTEEGILLSPIIIHSEANDKTEQAYTVTELELLAVVRVFMKHRELLLSNKVILFTDHRNITFLSSSSSKKMARWLAFLSQFFIIFQWIAGSDNIFTDYLSRNALPDDLLCPKRGAEEPPRIHRVSSLMDFRTYKGLPFSDSTSSSYSLVQNGSTFPGSVAVVTRSKKVREPSSSDVETLRQPPLPQVDLSQQSSTSLSSPTNPVPSPSEEGKIEKRIKEQIFSRYHSDMAGHHGINTTLNTLKNHRFDWPNIKEDLTLFIKSCEKCQISANSQSAASDHIWPSFHPWERVHLDHIHLPVNPRGMKYLLVATDSFSRYTEMMPSKEASAREYVSFLATAIYPRYGLPQCIVSDNGTAFTADLSSEYARMMGYKHIFTTPGNSAENGVVEVTNRMIKSYLTKVFSLHTGPKDWTRWVAPLQRVLNFSYSSAINTYPAKLLFGESIQGIDSTYNRVMPRVKYPEGALQYLEDLNEDLHEVLEATQEVRLSNNIKRKKSKFHKRVSEIHFSPGHAVLILRTSLAGKLQPRWTGPYEVVSCSNATVECFNPLNGKTKLFPKKYAKRFFPRDDDRIKDPVFTPIALEEDEYFVESILNHFSPVPDPLFTDLEDMNFLVKWVGYDDPTVEPFENVCTTEALLLYLRRVAPEGVADRLNVELA